MGISGNMCVISMVVTGEVNDGPQNGLVVKNTYKRNLARILQTHDSCKILDKNLFEQPSQVASSLPILVSLLQHQSCPLLTKILSCLEATHIKQLSCTALSLSFEAYPDSSDHALPVLSICNQCNGCTTADSVLLCALLYIILLP